MVNKKTIPFVKPPSKWLNDGRPKLLYKGSRWYCESGPVTFMHHWMNNLNTELAGNLIPLQWAPDFIGVSRTALLKRAKSGGLTIMSFQIVTVSKTFMGGVKERDTKQRYDYAVLSECIAWRSILLDRSMRSQINKGAKNESI